MTVGIEEKSGIEIVDLRQYRDPELLRAAYDGLYSMVFTICEEREDLEQYRSRLWGPAEPVPAPSTHFLVAGRALRDPARRQVCGLLIFEAYGLSSCGLATFLAVDPGGRESGVARSLIASAMRILADEMPGLGAGRPLAAVFAEAHHPALVDPRTEPIDPHVRLRILRRLGAGLLPFHYVQPELGPGRGRSRNLVFLSMFEAESLQPRQLAGSVVIAFLHEFYRALGIVRPDDDLDFTAMVDELRCGGAPAVAADQGLAALIDRVAIV